MGFFDGMHEGHRYIMSTVITLAKGLKYDSAVVTFPVHPRKVLQADYQPQLLTTTEERYEMIRESGIDHCISLEFTPELAALSARDFMKKLRDEYRVDALVVGYDHRFGRNRSDNLQDYMQYGFELKMVVFPIEPYINDKFKQVIVSSSLIRQIALKGDVRTASRYLTYHYFLQGTVTSGYQVGRTLGFPTANVKVDNPDKIIPADGVYAVEVVIEGQTYRGMLYIGTRPTLHNGPERSIEVNIFDFDQDIYNSPIRLIFIDYVRKDLKFDSVEELTAQLHRDREAVLKMF
ncbi:MAG: riboflavin biosynthesis protein RibF [Mediterranea sp.]|nr:riboflavin biosynthesis protein RibF [Mediterranea sp.]